jgi:5'(3')-deoxyribonucleotidase
MDPGKSVMSEHLSKPYQSPNRKAFIGGSDARIIMGENEATLLRLWREIPGARRVLRRLSDENYHIRIITHRLFIHYFHALAVQQTIEWLDHHGIPYHDLCFMKEKEQVGADIYIEDSPKNVASLRARGLYTICFANSTNRDVGDPRAQNWDGVHELIKARK